MNKKLIFFTVLVFLGLGGWYVFQQKVGSINVPEITPITQMQGTGPDGRPIALLSGFDLPAGFGISIFAKDVKGARALETDPKGRMLVSQTGEGKIVVLLDENYDNVSEAQKILAEDLKKPHGIAMRCEAEEKCFLYVAEADTLSRYAYDAEVPTLGLKEKLMSIKYTITDRHFTRSLIFLPVPQEDILLVSVGSSCDVCLEKHPEQASIIAYNVVTGKKEIYAKGLRNSPFMAMHPVSGKVYATEMGRDGLGDDLPPDEINIIETRNNQPKNYGWPICYAKNIHDTSFDKNTYIRNPCLEPYETASFIDLPAHSAPLGLAFIPEEGWAEEYWYNMLVAYHGSWNRSTPTGYKIARIIMNAEGKYLGTEDFISGWLTSNGKKTGRPVDIKIFPGGVMYISDDSAGVVYRVAQK